MRNMDRALATLALIGLATTALAGSPGPRQKVIPIGASSTCVCYERVKPDSILESYRPLLNIRPDWCNRDVDSAIIERRSLRTTTWFGSSASSEIGQIVDTTITDTIQWIGGVGR